MSTWQIIFLVWFAYAVALNIALIRKAPRSNRTGPATRGWGNRARVLIIGATGGTGKQLVQQALEQGHQVTAFVRKPQRLKIEHPNLRVVQGNVLDPDSVDAAVHGQAVVLSALGHKRFFWPTKILSRGTENVLSAMKTHRVPRFICESSLGVGNAVGRLGIPATFLFLPLLLHFYFYDRVRQETIIAESDRDWVIVRPSALTNGAARGSYRHGFNVGNYILPTRISRADVADFMLKQLNDDTYLGRAVGIAY